MGVSKKSHTLVKRFRSIEFRLKEIFGIRVRHTQMWVHIPQGKAIMTCFGTSHVDGS